MGGKRATEAQAVRPFGAYPPAVNHEGLVFVSGVRGDNPGEVDGFGGLPPIGRGKEQGYPIADYYEGQVAAESWRAHANLDAVLKAAGSAGDQILRQHIW